ncbi:hypothetical protein ACGFXB_37330 [Streptomyces canus]|uniref:hypothetical protein n=1 Tax=Streptomyces canus TaxID=58343 RepID=UPI003717018A
MSVMWWKAHTSRVYDLLGVPHWRRRRPPWSIALIAALTARTRLYLFRRGAEADIAERRQWRTRVRG